MRLSNQPTTLGHAQLLFPSFCRLGRAEGETQQSTDRIVSAIVFLAVPPSIPLLTKEGLGEVVDAVDQSADHNRTRAVLVGWVEPKAKPNDQANE